MTKAVTAPQELPGNWHETRRKLMLRGRHGAILQGWILEKDGWMLAYGFFCMFLSVALGLTLGYFNAPTWVVVLFALGPGPIIMQGVHTSVHEFSHYCTPVQPDSLLGFWVSFMLGSPILSDHGRGFFSNNS